MCALSGGRTDQVRENSMFEQTRGGACRLPALIAILFLIALGGRVQAQDPGSCRRRQECHVEGCRQARGYALAGGELARRIVG